jgi:hypothetical protein
MDGTPALGVGTALTIHQRRNNTQGLVLGKILWNEDVENSFQDLVLMN